MELPPTETISEERKTEIENGSKIAKAGFQAEKDVVTAFQQWKTNDHAKNWIKQLGYTAASIKELQAKIIKGSHKNSKDSRRMFLSELTDKEQQGVIQFFSKHKTNIITELFQGSEEIKPDWFMVIQKSETYNRTVLKPIDKIIAHYEQGAVKLSPRGSLEIGKVKMQRKGGDNGRPTANMLQFKIDPVEIFNIDEHKKSPE